MEQLPDETRSRLELTFGQLEALIAHIHHVNAARHFTMRGRLQHLQRLSFPDGVKVGRGAKVRYDGDQIMQILIALELAACRIAPTYAVRLINAIWPDIGREILHVLETARASKLDRGSLLVIKPDGLSLFRDESRTEIDTIDEVQLFDREQFIMQVNERVDLSRLLVIDLGKLATMIAVFLEDGLAPVGADKEADAS